MIYVMTHIKKLVMHGFKSFARRTEIPFEDGMNVIVGPNGSGKSNITDALCFVLGRLSIKSIRAAKAANLIFSGNKSYKGSNEAYVELIFSNEDKTFVFGTNTPSEVSIKRIVKKNGSSTYKINGETKTRQELLELLAQAGIDPQGFNIVLQGEIASMIKASPEERRRIIEEVAGISVYETRKKKSLKELEKTEEKLKEVSAVLKERTSYMRNLEKERQDALNYQKLEKTIKRAKATILEKSIEEKKKEIWGAEKLINSEEKEIKKIKSKIKEKNENIEQLHEEINKINKNLQSSTNNEQEILHKEISNLRAELAGLQVRKENFESRFHDGSERITELKKRMVQSEEELQNKKSSSPEIKEKQSALKNTQEKFDQLEKKRRQFYMIKSELSTLENNKEEKEKSIIEIRKEIELITRNIDALFEEIKFAKSLEQVKEQRAETRKKLDETKEKIQELNDEKNKIGNRNAILEKDIEREEKLKVDIKKLDTCPVCRNNVTEQHIGYVTENANKKIESAKKQISENENREEEIKEKIYSLQELQEKLSKKINELEIDQVKIANAEDKKEQIKRLEKQKEEDQKGLHEIDEKLKKTKEGFEKLKNIEDEYEDTRLRLQELSFADVDVDSEIKMAQQKIERDRAEIKSITRDLEESEQELKKIDSQIKEKEKVSEKKEEEEQILYEKFQKFYQQRNEIQDKQKVIETELIGMQHTIKVHEEKINSSNIQKAQFNAQLDSLKTERSEYGEQELMPGSIEKVRESLQKAQFKISGLGNVNMKALEAYDKIEEQCQQIQEKVETIDKEKEKIMQIIEEIDKKKKKAFMQTLDELNKYFTRNFTQLSKKGEVFLELENKKDPFEGGLNILVRVSRGRYFDITSLSGGEKTMVALSLIFAIQEYKPYCFYIFDEIDAALDKHNSELLAALIKKYMTTGQYIIITHNDTLISEATTLYGVSMQENISKVISLKV